jgi:hypothetical protein
MTDFNYWEGIREDFGHMISEIGTSCTIETPTHTIDTWGNLVSTSYSTTTETIWARQYNEVMDVEGIGQMNREDIRFVAKYNTAIDVETRITFNGIKYVVIGIDSPNESGYQVNRVGYAKKELT